MRRIWLIGAVVLGLMLGGQLGFAGAQNPAKPKKLNLRPGFNARRAKPQRSSLSRTGEKAKGPRSSGPFLSRAGCGQLDLDYVGCLLTLRSFHDIELKRLTLGQALESVALDRRIMHENIVAVRSLDESEALGIVEPLYGTRVSHVLFSLLSS